VANLNRSESDFTRRHGIRCEALDLDASASSMELSNERRRAFGRATGILSVALNRPITRLAEDEEPAR
jgi:hypothetical protein